MKNSTLTINKKKRNIIIFNGFYLPHLGGVERYTFNLVSKLKKYYNITIVTTNTNNTLYCETCEGITIYRLPIYNLFKNRYPLLRKNNEYKKIIRKIYDNDYDHVICNTRYYLTTILGVKLAQKKNIDLSIIDHSSSHVSIGNKILDFFGNKYEDYLTYKIIKSNPRFYGVSNRVNEWLKYYGIKASGIFYNSINKENVKKVKNKIITITYAGRIIKEKGVENLVIAFKKLESKYNIKLNIAGDGSYLSYLKENYPDKNISYLGSLNHQEVMKLLLKTDIFVHPSMYPEGLPTSILEAGMMKCAIIATDRGGTKEVISDNNIGIIVEENVEDLTSKIEQLLKNPKRIEMYQNNIYKKICDDFTWTSTSETVRKELIKYEK